MDLQVCIRETISRITASLMWEAQAFKVSIQEPFRLVSGNYSPIYVNCRALISIPFAMDMISAFMHWFFVHYEINADIVAGGETAGIPFAAVISQKLNKPMVYVRKKTKEHGEMATVEGLITKDNYVVLIEDLITDGRSKLSFIQTLSEAGAKVNTCLVVFDRDQGGSTLLASEGVALYFLTDLNTTLKIGRETHQIADIQYNEIQSYLRDPARWHNSRGLTYK